MKEIPERTRSRLVTLARLLGQIKEERVTSAKISLLTGWSESLIRRDISVLEVNCGSSNGYRIEELRKAICKNLGIECGQKEIKCCIVGLGRLGAALLENSIFEGSPFKIIAGFDSNVNRTEVLRSSFPLHPASMLESVIQKEGIEYAILAVPDTAAQDMAARLAKTGIKGIANYTGAVLTLQEEIPVQNVSPVTALTNLLAEQRKN